MKNLNLLIEKKYRLIIGVIEKFLALVILVALLLFIGYRTLNADIYVVNSTEFIQSLISDILLMVLGLELVRLLIVPSIKATIELLTFVVARKLLTPKITSVEIILDVVAFAILILLNYYCANGGGFFGAKRKKKN